MHLITKFSERIQTSLLDEKELRYFLLVCSYAVLNIISSVMTLANILTHKRTLTLVTLLFAVICASVFALLLLRKISLTLARAAFVASCFPMLTYFIISGSPDGFSILWICMLPACGLLVFGRVTGSFLCLSMFVELIFLLLTPLGQSFVLYAYSETFKMRFPLLFLAFYGASLMLESIRELTHNKLVEVQARYRSLYSHDALTEVYNRHGFNELMDRYFQQKQPNLGLIILDIDFFKHINDEYGHTQGDLVLQHVARVIVESAGASANVCRWGGEEFAVLLPDGACLCEIAERLAEQIRSESIPLETGVVHITTSIGAVLARDTAACTAAQLVSCADACLYRAKLSGRDRAVCDTL